jgi:hypothetical protein
MKTTISNPEENFEKYVSRFGCSVEQIEASLSSPVERRALDNARIAAKYVGADILYQVHSIGTTYRSRYDFLHSENECKYLYAYIEMLIACDKQDTINASSWAEELLAWNKNGFKCPHPGIIREAQVVLANS